MYETARSVVPRASMRPMSAAELVTRLAEALDSHAWGDLSALLHDDFVCRCVHTGETFGTDAWLRLNAGYPGFERFVVQDTVAGEHRAVVRAHVTGSAEGRLQHVEVATFVTEREGLIAEMTEVWADVDETPPEGTRPGEDPVSAAGGG